MSCKISDSIWGAWLIAGLLAGGLFLEIDRLPSATAQSSAARSGMVNAITFPGSDACAKIQNALGALSKGGIVDAREFAGVQVCAGAWHYTYSSQTVLLGDGEWKLGESISETPGQDRDALMGIVGGDGPSAGNGTWLEVAKNSNYPVLNVNTYGFLLSNVCLAYGSPDVLVSGPGSHNFEAHHVKTIWSSTSGIELNSTEATFLYDIQSAGNAEHGLYIVGPNFDTWLNGGFYDGNASQQIFGDTSAGIISEIHAVNLDVSDLSSVQTGGTASDCISLGTPGGQAVNDTQWTNIVIVPCGGNGFHFWNAHLNTFSDVTYQSGMYSIQWAASHAYSFGQRIYDSHSNIEEATKTGKSGPLAPTWSPSVGGTTRDGSMIWTNLGKARRGFDLHDATANAVSSVAIWGSNANPLDFGIAVSNGRENIFQGVIAGRYGAAYLDTSATDIYSIARERPPR